MKKIFTVILIIFSCISLYAGESSWTFIGSDDLTTTGASYTSIALDSKNTPYLIFSNNTPRKTKSIMTNPVVKFDGTNWVNVGTSPISEITAQYTTIKIDSNDTPYIAFINSSNESRVTVMKFDGTDWAIVGTAGFSTPGASWLTFALDSNDTPYVGFLDGSNSGKGSVMKFDGTDWIYVGTQNFTTGTVPFFSLAINNSNEPLVAFMDNSNSGKTTVMKFDGTDWAVVGTAGFSEGENPYITFAIDKNDVPYVAFLDTANNGKANVMKFDGTDWVYVGNTGFSSGSPNYISLIIDKNNDPVIAYMDGSIESRAVVMKFKGGIWKNIGNAGFTNQGAQYNSLAVTSNNAIFLGYVDGTKSNTPRVALFANYLTLEDDEIGTNCNNYGFGGKRRISGMDGGYGNGIMNNDMLEEDEIMEISYICYTSDSSDKHSSLTVTDDQVGTNCDNYGGSGQRIRTGLDDGNPTGTADNNILEDGEVDSTVYVCNGANGENGANGTNGENGIDGTNGETVLVTTVTEPQGANCANGGIAVLSGVDTDGDNALSEKEVKVTSYICNGATGKDGSGCSLTTVETDKSSPIALILMIILGLFISRKAIKE